MSVNLANVNISLDQFQAVSSGEYNAGEVKLDTETTLKKVNNHVHLTVRNKVVLSHAEVLAIKNAFVQALSQNGVNREELDRVRRDLGLAPDGEADKELRKRSVTPLSRQKIREILDRNAGDINTFNAEHHAVARIRTSAEIYGANGMDAAHVEKRDAVNATLADPHRQVAVHDKVSTLQAIVANAVDYGSATERNAILKMAVEQLDVLMQNCHCRPQEDGRYELKYKLGTGQTVVLQTGMSQAGFARRLEDIIVRLRSERTPTPREQPLRRQFAALASSEAKNAFLDSLFGTEEGGFKARVVAMQLLSNAGITDYDTLAVVNQLADADAILLAKRLVSLGPKPGADTVRNDPLVRALAQKPGVPVDDAAMAYVPATATCDYNGTLRHWIVSAPEKVFPEFQQVLNDVAMEVRSCFGERGLPDGLSLAAVIGSAGLTRVFSADELALGLARPKPDAIRDTLLDAAKNTAADRMLVAAMRSALEAVEGGVPGDASVVKFNLCFRHPEMMERLKAAKSSDEAAALLTEFAARIAEAARFHVECKRIAGLVADWARSDLASRMGVPVAGLAGKAVALDKLTANAKKLVDKLERGEVPVPAEGGLEAAFRELAKNFVSERMQFLQKVDALDLPEVAKDEMKEDLLQVADIKDIDLDFIAAEAAKLDVSELVSVLKGNTSKAKVYAAMGKLSAKIDEAVQKMLAHKQDIGQDDTVLPNQLFVSMLVRSQIGLEKRLDVFFSRADVRDDDFYYGDGAPNGPSSAQKFLRYSPVGGGNANASLIAKLGTATLPPLAAQALIAAVNDEIPGNHTAEEALAVFAPGTKIGEMLRQQLNHAPGAVTPFSLGVLARGVIRGHRASMAAAPQEIAERFAPQGAATQQALAKGYFSPEMEMLRRTAELYQAATECSVDEAIQAALDHTSTARRLFSYGGRFTASTANFKDGLKLMRDFANWFADLNVQLASKHGVNGHAPAGASVTVVNANAGYFQNKTLRAFEKFLFEEIAINDAIPLKPENPEQAFGMEANPAMRFVGRGYTKSSANSLAQLPPERRSVLYAVFDLLSPLGATEAEVKANSLDNFNCELISRVLKHFDEVVEMKDAGELTRENFLASFFPDIENAPNLTNRELMDYFALRLLKDVIPNRFGGDATLLVPIANMLQFTGATLDEVVNAAVEGRTLPLAPGLSSANGPLDELDGTSNGGRKAMLMDLPRPSMPTLAPDEQPALAEENCVFKVVFPDGTVLKSVSGAEDDADVAAANNAIAAKVAQFCGNVHPQQLGSVYFALSQSGASDLNRGLEQQYGIHSSEHAPVTYTLAKDQETGAITIRYSEPEGFPVHFHWETTIATDGTTTTTAMEVDV